MGGYKKITTEDGKATQFTSENQPSKEAKKRGMAKRSLNLDIKKLLISALKGEVTDREVKKVTKQFGIVPSNLAELLHAKQISKAVEGDTKAYEAVTKVAGLQKEEKNINLKTEGSIEIDFKNAE